MTTRELSRVGMRSSVAGKAAMLWLRCCGGSPFAAIAEDIARGQAMRRRGEAALAGMFVVACALGAGLPATAMAAEGNASDGAEVFKKCRACHDVGPTAKNKVGPLLNGILGRPAGSIEGFNYSEANKAAGAKGLVWSEEVMLKYLENPISYMPGTKMAFAGLKDERDRLDVIAYLKSFPK